MTITRIFKTLLVYQIVSHLDHVSAKRSKLYVIPRDCKSNKVRDIDGAVIQSRSDIYTPDPCLVKFQSDEENITSKMLMINFESFEIRECDVVLELFYGTTVVGQPNVRLTCRSQNPGIIDTKSRYVTFKLDRRGSQAYDFKIVVTTYLENLSCLEFLCRGDTFRDNRCIDSDLRCDGEDHCFDGSDERGCLTAIGHGDIHKIFNIGIGAMVGIALTIALCCLCCIVVACACRRRRKYRGHITRRPPDQVVDQTISTPVLAAVSPANNSSMPQVQPYTDQPPPAYAQTYPQQQAVYGGPPPGMGPPVYAPPGALPPPLVSQPCYYAPPPSAPPMVPPPPYNPAYAPAYKEGVTPPNISYNVRQQAVTMPIT